MPFPSQNVINSISQTTLGPTKSLQNKYNYKHTLLQAAYMYVYNLNILNILTYFNNKIFPFSSLDIQNILFKISSVYIVRKEGLTAWLLTEVFI